MGMLLLCALLFATAVAAEPPGAPTNVSAAGTGLSRELQLSWLAPESDGGAAITMYVAYLDSVATAWLADGLVSTAADGVTYSVAVSAVNSAGEGPISDSVEAQTWVPVEVGASAVIGPAVSGLVSALPEGGFVVGYDDGLASFNASLLRTSLVSTAEPEALVVGDLNGDGTGDVAIYDTDTGYLYLYRNPGFVHTASVEMEVNAMALGDVDGDGSLDLLSVGNDSVQYSLNDGDMNFLLGWSQVPAGSELAFPGVPAFLDANASLAVPMRSTGEVVVFLNVGSGGTQQKITGMPGAWKCDAGDLDGDGDDDLVVAGSSQLFFIENVAGTGLATAVAFADVVPRDFTVRSPYVVLSTSAGGVAVIADQVLIPLLSANASAGAGLAVTADLGVVYLSNGTQLSWFQLEAAPAAPESVRVADVWSGSVGLSWDGSDDDDDDGETSYAVLVDGESWAAQEDGVVSGLTNGVSYSFAVQASNYRGTGAASDAVAATPTPLSVVSVSSLNNTLGAKAANGLACGDVSGDGVSDFVVAFSGSHEVNWFDPVANASHHTTEVTATGSPSSVAVFDIDDDGDLDVVVTAFGSNSAGQVLWMENLFGNGTFAPAVQVGESGGGPYGVAAGDLDGDGAADICFGRYSVGEVACVFGPSFATEQLLGTGSTPVGVLLVESMRSLFVSFEEDDAVRWYQDLALKQLWSFPAATTARVAVDEAVGLVVPVEDVVYVFRFDASRGNFSETPDLTLQQPYADSGILWNAVAMADVDLDSDLDIVVSSSLALIMWFENDGQGGFPTAPYELYFPDSEAGDNGLCLVDVDTDGDADAVVVRSADDVSFDPVLILELGSVPFAPPGVAAEPTGYSDAVRVSWSASDGNGEAVTSYSVYAEGNLDDALATTASGADLEVIVDAPTAAGRYVVRAQTAQGLGAASETVSAWPSLRGRLSLLADLHSFERPADVVALDVDGDGLLDLATADSLDTGDEVAWFRNPTWSKTVLGSVPGASGLLAVAGRGLLVSSLTAGGLVFVFNDSAASTITVDAAADGLWALRAGDVDNDGEDEIIFAVHGANGSSSSLGFVDDGQQVVPIEATAEAGFFAVADFSGDGIVDLFLPLRSNSSAAEYRTNDGEGTFALAQSWTLPADPNVAQAGDVDGDGLLDVVLTTAAGVVVLTNLGQGLLGDPVAFATTGASGGPLLLFDVNLDDALDIVVAFDDGALVWTNGSLVLDSAATAMVAADLDGDGDDDLALVSSTGLDLRVYEVQTAPLAATDFEAVATGDAGSVLVSWTGAATATSYVVVASDSDDVVTNETTVEITGLENRQEYAFAVTAVNVFGAASSSDESDVVIPYGPPVEVDLNASQVVASFASSLLDGIEIAAADVDGDGADDLITVTSSLVWFKSPTWTAMNITTTALEGAQVMALASELGGDGDPRLDLALALAGQSAVLLFFNLDPDTGAFSSTLEVTTAGTPTGLSIGDLNGDGALDVAVAVASADQVSFLLGPSLNATTVMNGSPSSPMRIDVADLDADGLEDVIVPCGDGLQWFTTSGGTNSVRQSISMPGNDTPQAVRAGDVDADGDVDVVLLALGSVFYVPSEGGGAALSSEPITLSSVSGGSFSLPPLVDLDLSGTLDVVLLDSWIDVASQKERDLYDGQSVLASAVLDGEVAVAFQTGFFKTVQWLVLDTAPTVAVVDESTGATGEQGTVLLTFEADDPDADIWVAQDGGEAVVELMPMLISELQNGRAYSFSAYGRNDHGAGPTADTVVLTPYTAPIEVTATVTEAASVQGRPRAVVSADVDGDGLLDVVAACQTSGSVSWYRNPTWEAIVLSSSVTGARDVAASDLDGDGLAEIIVSAQSVPAIVVFSRNGTESASYVPGGEAAFQPWGVAVGDVTGDGVQDIVYSLFNEHAVGALEGPDFLSDTALSTDDMTSPAYLALADFDADGRLDVVVPCAGSEVRFYLSSWDNGTASQALAVPTYAMYARTGDVDGDGDVDVFVSTSLGSSLYFVENLGGGGVMATPAVLIGPDGGEAYGLAIVDLDLSGTLDVVVAMKSWSQVMWLSGSGDGSFADAQVLLEGSDFWGVAAFDVDLDGDTDLAAVSAESGTVEVLVVGTVPFAPTGLAARPSGFSGSVLLEWDSGVANNGAEVTSYLVYLNGSLSTATSATEVEVTGLTDGQSYNFSVSGINYRGTGPLCDAVQASPLISVEVGVETLIGSDSPHAVTATDMDADGRPDVVIISLGLDSVSWYSNPDWLETVINSESDDPHAVAVLADPPGSLVVADNGNWQVDVYRDAELWADLEFSTPPWSVAVGDFSGDGEEDIIAALAFEVVLIPGPWFNESVGGLTADTSPVLLMFVELGDVDSDGALDVLVLDQSGQFWWATNGTTVQTWDVGSVDTDSRARPADVNNDGHVDVVVSAGSAVRYFANRGDGSGLDEPVLLTAPASATALRLVDLDQSGTIDIVAGQDSVEWYPGNGDGTFGAARALVDSAVGAVNDLVVLDGYLAYISLDDGALVITELFTPPQPPTITAVTATGFSGTVLLEFSEGTGTTATSYSLASPSGLDLTTTRVGNTSLEVTGLENGVAYSFSLTASNEHGTSLASAASDSVVPYAPVELLDQVDLVGSLRSVVSIAADVDGDGDLDLVMAGSTASLSWYRNDNGGGGWVETVIIDYLGFVAVRAIEAFDFDGDGDQDICATFPISDLFAVLENSGSGVFSSYRNVSFGEGSQPMGLGVADDGRLFYSLTGAQEVGYVRAPDFNVSNRVVLSDDNPDGPTRIALADLDDDEDVDVLVPCGQAQEFRWYSATNRTARQAFLFDESPAHVEAGDVDLDGDTDVVLSWYDGVSLLQNTGGWLADPVLISTELALRANGIQLVDLNLDGALDVVVAFRDEPVAWVSGNGDSTFGDLRYLAMDMGDEKLWDVTAFDVDQDGDLDLAVTSSIFDVVANVLRLGTVPPAPTGLTAVPTGESGVVVVKWDSADADASFNVFVDAVLWTSGSTATEVEITGLTNGQSYNFSVSGTSYRGTGPLCDAVQATPSGSAEVWVDDPTAVLATDVNGDGLVDLVVCAQSTGVLSWYRNPDWSETVVIAEQSSASLVAMAALSSGGAIVVADNAQHRVSLFRNSFNGGNFTVTSTDLPSAPSSVCVGDFSGDGEEDIAVALADEVVLLPGPWFNESSSLLAAVAVFAELGDIDSDGALDLLVLEDTNEFWWATNGAPPNVVQSWDLDTVDEFSRIRTGDVNNDGHVDVVVGAQSAVLYFANLGAESALDEPVLLTAITRTTALRLVDLDQSGTLDIVVALTSDDSIALLSGNGDGTFVDPVGLVDGASFVGDLAVLPQYLARIMADDNVLVVTELFMAPQPPTITAVTATGFSGTVLLEFSESTGTATSYSLVSPSGLNLTTTRVGNTTLEVTGLENGVAYSFSLTASNEYGTSLASAASDSAVPYAPVEVLEEVDVSEALGSTPAVISADIDGDGDLDLVMAGSNASLSWFSYGEGGWNETVVFDFHSPVVRAWTIEAFDTDGDGDVDVAAVFRFSYDELMFFENTGGGEFISHLNVSFPDDSTVSGLRSTGDGRLYYTLAGEDEVGYLTLPDFNVSDRVTLSDDRPDGPADPAVVDLGGDGSADVLVPCRPGKQFRWYSPSNLTAMQVFTFDAAAYSVDAGDVDGDSDLDVVVAHYHGVAYFDNVGEAGGWLADPVLISSDGGPVLSTVRLADLDFSGTLDAVVVFRSEGAAWFEGLGNATFDASPRYLMSDAPTSAFFWSLAVFDATGDGDLDLALGTHSYDEGSVFLDLATVPLAPADAWFSSGTRLAWTDSANDGGAEVTSYVVASGSGSRWTTTDSFLEVEPGDDSYYAVAAVNYRGVGPFSSEVSDADPVETPSAVSASGTGVSGEVVVEWAGSVSAAFYTVFVDGEPWLNTTATEVAVSSGLSDGAVYSFQVSAWSAAGLMGELSDAAQATPFTVPLAPAAVAASVVDGISGTVTVTWGAPADDGGAPVSSYTVLYADSSLLTVGAGNLSVDVTGLVNGQAYSFAVAARNAAGLGPPSANATAVPWTPVEVTITTVNDTVGFSGRKSFVMPFGDEDWLTAGPLMGLMAQYSGQTWGDKSADYFGLGIHPVTGDIYASSRTLDAVVAFNASSGNETARFPCPPLSDPSVVEFGDINGDGQVELLVGLLAGDNPVVGFDLASHEPLYLTANTELEGGAYFCLGEQGNLYVPSYQGGGFSWYANSDGRGNFTLQQSWDGLPLAYMAKVADGGGDVVVTVRNANSILLFASLQTGELADPVVITAALGAPTVFLMMDLDLSGTADLVVACNDDANIVWLSAAGDGSYGPVRVLDPDMPSAMHIASSLDGSVVAAVGSLSQGAVREYRFQTVPTAPAWLNVSEGNETLTISWGAAESEGAPVLGYNVYPFGLFSSALTVTVTGLVNGETYGVAVSGESYRGEGPTTATLDAVPFDAYAGVADSLLCSAFNGQATLQWKAPLGAPYAPPLSYRVTFDSEELFVDADTHWLLLSGLQDFRSYNASVAVVNRYGTGPEVGCSFTAEVVASVVSIAADDAQVAVVEGGTCSVRVDRDGDYGDVVVSVLFEGVLAQTVAMPSGSDASVWVDLDIFDDDVEQWTSTVLEVEIAVEGAGTGISRAECVVAAPNDVRPSLDLGALGLLVVTEAGATAEALPVLPAPLGPGETLAWTCTSDDESEVAVVGELQFQGVFDTDNADGDVNVTVRCEAASSTVDVYAASTPVELQVTNENRVWPFFADVVVLNETSIPAHADNEFSLTLSGALELLVLGDVDSMSGPLFDPASLEVYIGGQPCAVRSVDPSAGAWAVVQSPKYADLGTGYFALELYNEADAVVSCPEHCGPVTLEQNAVYYTPVCVLEGQWGAGDDCVGCPRGGVCPGGYRLWSDEGYFVSDETQFEIEACDVPADTRCVGWNYDARTTLCGPGYSGYKCAGCATDFFDQYSRCWQCPETDFGKYWPLGALVVGAAATFVLVKVLIERHTRGVEADDDFAKRQAREIVLWVALTSQSFAQVCMDSSTQNSALAIVYSALAAFQLDLTAVTPPACLSHSPMLFELVLFSVDVYLLTLFLLGRSATVRRWLAGCSSAAVVGKVRRAVNIFLVVLHLLTANRIMSLTNCVDEGDGVLVMKSNVNIVCYEGDHLWAAALAWALLPVYVVGYPLLTLLHVRGLQQRVIREGALQGEELQLALQEVSIRRGYQGFTSGQFYPRYYYLVNANMMLNVALGVTGAYMSTSTLLVQVLRCLINVAMLGAGVAVLVRLQPFVPSQHWKMPVKLACMVLTAAASVLNLVEFVRSENEVAALDVPVDVFSYAVVLSFCLLYVVIVVQFRRVVFTRRGLSKQAHDIEMVSAENSRARDLAREEDVLGSLESVGDKNKTGKKKRKGKRPTSARIEMHEMFSAPTTAAVVDNPLASAQAVFAMADEAASDRRVPLASLFPQTGSVESFTNPMMPSAAPLPSPALPPQLHEMYSHLQQSFKSDNPLLAAAATEAADPVEVRFGPDGQGEICIPLDAVVDEAQGRRLRAAAVQATPAQRRPQLQGRGEVRLPLSAYFNDEEAERIRSEVFGENPMLGLRSGS